MRKDSLTIAKNAEGREYVEIRYNEVTKCDDGTKKKRAHGSKGLVTKEKEKRMWAESTGRCPVQTLKLYLSKLNSKNEFLFQRPNKSSSGGHSERWYDNQVLGVHTLENMMAKLSEKYGLSQRYTNHCIRATVVTELDKAGSGAADICHVTGHRSADSLKHYRTKVSSNQSQKMSTALHQFRTGNETTQSCSAESSSSGPNEIPASDSGNTMNINVTKNLLENELITGILSRAVFNGNVVINFNISK